MLKRYETLTIASQQSSHEWTRRLSKAHAKDDGENENDEKKEDLEDEEDGRCRESRFVGRIIVTNHESLILAW